MPIADMEFDEEAIASGIARWAALESPSYNRDAVNRMMNEAATVMGELGAVLQEWTGARMDEADIQEAIQEVDQNGDGVIDRLEFFELFRTASSKRRDPPPTIASEGARP